MLRILGIDPGSRKTGFGVISIDPDKPLNASYVTSGVIKLHSQPTMAARLVAIQDSLRQIVAEFHPDEMAIEQVFMGRNVDSAFKLGQARGVAIVAVAAEGLPVSEYAARLVKQSVTGSGAADKVQVQHMVKHLLKLPGLPQEDAADGLAIALCHAQHRHRNKLFDNL